ncbi:unnamed protein product [Trichobilharzia szidati]|nr:unnamed protein product [Trichobilharzia szidati]
MKETVIYNEKKPPTANDDYYDDEISETTWIVKIGDKNVTDKDILNYITKQAKNQDLFKNILTNNNTNDSDKHEIETETSWFTAPKTVHKLTDKKVDKFLDKEANLNHILKMFLPTNEPTKQPKGKVISRRIWYSDDFEKELNELDITGILKNSTELNNLFEKHLKTSSSLKSGKDSSESSTNYEDETKEP